MKELIEIFSFSLNEENDNYDYTEPDIHPIVDDFYKNLEVDKEFLEKTKIDLSKSEVIEIFGDHYASATADGGEIWLYDTVNEGFEYERRLDAVAHEEIKNGNVESQLLINII